MNYTENYHLPQWDETDRIMRTDFNAAMADIEAGLEKTAAGAAEANAQTAADAASAAKNAQSTADRAVTDAARAQAKADAAYSPSQPPYTVGTYAPSSVGNETAVNVGFRPSFLIISGGANSVFCCAAGKSTSSGHLVFTNTGFTVKRVYRDTTPPTEQEPLLMQSSTTYCYIAFR